MFGAPDPSVMAVPLVPQIMRGSYWLSPGISSINLKSENAPASAGRKINVSINTSFKMGHVNSGSIRKIGDPRNNRQSGIPHFRGRISLPCSSHLCPKARSWSCLFETRFTARAKMSFTNGEARKTGLGSALT